MTTKGSFRLAEDRQRHMLACAVQVAREIGLPEDALCLGGGAVLQARWNHRKADGLWLYAGWDAWTEASNAVHYQHHPEIIERAGGFEPMLDKYKALRWRTANGPIGLYCSTSYNKQGCGLSRQRESSTGIPVEEIRSIFSKKIRGRILELNQFTLRDAVDIIVCARKSRKGLSRATAGLSGERIRILTEEMLWQMRISPTRSREPQRSAWLAAASILEASAAGRPLPRHRNLELPETPPIPIEEPDRSDIELLPLKKFAHPAFSEDQSLASSSTPDRTMNKKMAGHPLNPNSREIRKWLHAEKERDLPDNAITFLSEYLKQVNGKSFASLRQNCGASLKDIVRIMSWTGPFKSPLALTILNRYPKLAESDETEDGDGNCWLVR